MQHGTRRSWRQVGGLVLAVALAVSAVGFGAESVGATTAGANGRIAFERETNGIFQIYTMDGVTNGTGVKITSLGSNRAPVYSPNGSVIAFVSDRVGGVKQIFLMGAGGDDQRNISPDGNCSDYPSFSQNGRSIVFAHYPDTTCTGNPDIWTVRRDGSDPTQVTNTPAQSELSPSYSPNGDTIVFSSHSAAQGSNAVFTMGADGNGRKRITPKYLDASYPDWAPDGVHITFSSNTDNANSNIYIWDDGLQITRVMPVPNGYENAAPRYSPDGKQIIFVSDRFKGELDLYSVRLSNKAVRRRGIETPNQVEYLTSWQALR